MAEKKTAKANKHRNQKKKRKNRKNTAKDISKFELSFLMDNIHENPQSASQHQIE